MIFTPGISDTEAREVVEDLCQRLSESSRILPGGYIYLSDLLSTPKILQNVGRIIANAFKGKQIDAVMTVATKGVPLANAVANVLNVPLSLCVATSKSQKVQPYLSIMRVAQVTALKKCFCQNEA